jgi:DNA-binding transcriptional LysR family regulator
VPPLSECGFVNAAGEGAIFSTIRPRVWTLPAHMLNLNDLHLFVRVVENGGFAAAARRVGVPKSTLSKRLAVLEAALGVQLLYRTSRSVTLTDVGRDFFQHAQASLVEAESAEAVVQRRLAQPSGSVKLTASVPVAQFYLADHLPALARTHPKLRVQLQVTDRFVDLVQEGVDIAVRSHFGPLSDSSLVQRRVADEPVWLVSSPAYLRERGTPAGPEDLISHDGLPTGPSSTVWRLRAADGREAEATPAPRMMADESLVLLRAAGAGLGIACLPEGICRRDVESGALVRVLPAWTAGTVTTTILVPDRRSQLPAVRAVIEFLTACLAPPPTSTATGSAGEVGGP